MVVHQPHLSLFRRVIPGGAKEKVVTDRAGAQASVPDAITGLNALKEPRPSGRADVR